MTTGSAPRASQRPEVNGKGRGRARGTPGPGGASRVAYGGDATRDAAACEPWEW